MIPCNTMDYLTFDIMVAPSIFSCHRIVCILNLFSQQIYSTGLQMCTYILSVICLPHIPFSAFPYQQETHFILSNYVPYHNIYLYKMGLLCSHYTLLCCVVHVELSATTSYLLVPIYHICHNLSSLMGQGFLDNLYFARSFGSFSH